jgi:hypothetical protein
MAHRQGRLGTTSPLSLCLRIVRDGAYTTLLPAATATMAATVDFLPLYKSCVEASLHFRTPGFFRIVSHYSLIHGRHFCSHKAPSPSTTSMRPGASATKGTHQQPPPSLSETHPPHPPSTTLPAKPTPTKPSPPTTLYTNSYYTAGQENGGEVQIRAGSAKE